MLKIVANVGLFAFGMVTVIGAFAVADSAALRLVAVGAKEKARLCRAFLGLKGLKLAL